METSNEYILRINQLTKSFPGVKVLKNINLTLKYGEVLGLVGENGAGKSTLMNILGGNLMKDSGQIFLEDKDYSPIGPLDAERKGIAFIHQELSLFSNLSIAENMFIENFPKKGLFQSVDFKAIKEKTVIYLKMLEVDLVPDSIVDNLAMGQRQLVEIAKALSKNAKVIIFDEPTSSLSNKEKMNLFSLIKKLRSKGISIIFISHILEDVYELCDRITVLRDGEIIGTDASANLDRDSLIKMMVGRTLNQLYPSIEKSIGDVVFEAKHINQGRVLKDVSFYLKEGEIVGIYGLMGAGRTELAKSIFGVDGIDGGEIYYENQHISPITPINCINKRMALITEDRRSEGLFMPKSVKENLISAYIGKITSFSILKIINKRKESQLSDKVVKELLIKTHNKDIVPVRNLSGGNQQKVVLGKWLLLEPKVLILDEPTRGVDVGAKYEIYDIINMLAKNKSAILMISSEMEELIGTCDRIMVMNKGKIVASFNKEEFVKERIMGMAIGGEI